mgnify:CR=1 FL=1
MLSPVIKAEIDAIRADNVNGATPLAMRAAKCLGRLADELDPGSDSWPALLEAAAALVAAQPVMAPIINLVNVVLLETEEGESRVPFPERLARAAERFQQQRREFETSITR